MQLNCRFGLFALQPINKFTTVFQTSAARIGSMQDDTLSLLRGYVTNFVKPEVITSAEDITAIDYCDLLNQLPNDALAIGTVNLLFLFEFEDETEGTTLERLIVSVCSTKLLFQKCWPNFLSKTKH